MNKHERALYELGRVTLKDAETTLQMHENGLKPPPCEVDQSIAIVNLVKFFEKEPMLKADGEWLKGWWKTFEKHSPKGDEKDRIEREMKQNDTIKSLRGVKPKFENQYLNEWVVVVGDGKVEKG